MNHFFLWPQTPGWEVTATLHAAHRFGPTLPSGSASVGDVAIPAVCGVMVVVFVIGALRRELGAATLVGLFLGGLLMALGTVTP
ncbi:MAG: hypothetical protein O3A14_02055 [Cyanobacteria bacterium]|nr:hypothetical protein [Cyanobacteriota bacterium]